MKSKLYLFFCLLIVLSLLLFNGCRLKESKPEQESFHGITLTYYKMFDEKDVIEPIINDYIASRPGLKIQYRMFSDFDEYMNLLLDEMAEGEGPDIFSAQNTWFVPNYRKLYPMPDDFGSIQDFALTFVDVAYKDLVRTDQDGIERVYGLPMTVDTLALYYNKDHFEDRLPTQGRPSSTWDGIVQDVQSLTMEDNSFSRFTVSGIALGRGDNINRAVDIVYLLFLQNGLKFYNDNISKAIFASRQSGAVEDAALKALEFYTSFANPNMKNYSWNELVVGADSREKEVEAFARGDVSMIVGYAYMYDDIINQISVLSARGARTINADAIRIAQIPQVSDSISLSQKRVTYANYFAEAVSRNSKHPDIAWDFLIFLTSKSNQAYYFDKLHKPTSRRDLLEEQRSHPIYGVFATQAGFAESFPIVDYYRYKIIFTDLIDKINESGVDIKFLNEAQTLIDALLPSSGFLVPKAVAGEV